LLTRRCDPRSAGAAEAIDAVDIGDEPAGGSEEKADGWWQPGDADGSETARERAVSSEHVTDQIA
jgi:hypothetical protein